MTKSAKKYKYPSIETLQPVIDQIQSKSDHQVIASLKRFEDQRTSYSSPDYTKDRSTLCAFHIALNERGLTSPSFRPFPKLDKFTGLSDEEKTLGCDIQIINLHYMFCHHKEKYTPEELEFRSLFKGSIFDFSLASKYALKGWKADTSSDISLSADEPLQLELSTYRGQEARSRLHTIYESLKKMKTELNRYHVLPISRLRLEDIPVLLDVYECLRYGRGSAKLATRFYKLKKGVYYYDTEDRSYRYMSKKKKWFEDQLKVKEW